MIAAAAAAVALAALELVRRALRRRRIFIAAFLEQGRREHHHHVKYRFDQRVNAIQQRLSRHLGRRAFSGSTKRRIEKELHRHGLV